MFNLNINYTFLALFIVFFYLLLNYYHLIKAKTNHFKNLLIIIRTIILIFVLILFVNPNIESLNEKNKTIDLIVDNSKSMSYNSQNINRNIEKILNWSSENFINVNIYLFGDNYRKISNINEVDFTDDYTSFGEFFGSHNTNNDIILLSDGINNYGSSEIDYEQFNSINIIGFGDNDYLDLDINIELVDTLIYNEKIEIDVIVNKNITNQKISGKIFLSNNNNNNQKIIGSYNLNKLNSQEITLTLSKIKLKLLLE